MLRLQNVSKTFRSGETDLEVLKNIDLEISSQKSVAIVGPSGSGKSTLLSLMAGLDQPSVGKVILDGIDLTMQTADELARLRNKKIGYVFQFFELLPSFTALENVLFPLELQGKRNVRKAEELLAKVGLADRGHHFPHQLSGGEQQRVAIARAFVHDPEIVFGDEPTGNLDEENGNTVMELLFAFVRDEKKTLVLITHDQQISARTDAVFRLRNGTLNLDR